MKNETESEECYKCFVPYCPNNSRTTGKSLKFFQVPAGIEGLHWKKAVNNARKKQYERMIELLKKKSQINLKSHLTQAEYCCEVHFKIETDIERVLYADGSIEFRVRPGSIPSIQALRQTRIDEFDFEQLYTIIMNQKEESDRPPKNEFVSLVDISTISTFPNRNVSCEPIGMDLQHDVKSEPMMPLTVALMKKKSVFYTGLQQSHLARLISLTVQQTSLTEVMVMLTLRKLRLDEDLEVLGDLFDVDKTIAEQYLEISKGLVLDLSETVTKGVSNDLPNSIMTTNNVETNSNSIKLEPIFFSASNSCSVEKITSSSCSVDDEREFEANVVEEESEEDETESDSSISIKGDDDDPDFDKSSSESSDYSECESDSLDTESDTSIEKTKSLCPYCNVAVYQLSSHIQNIHLNASNVNKTICGLCLNKFLTRRHMRCHQHEVHGSNAYSCDICGSMWKTYRELKKHMSRTHAPIKDILCDLCGDRFTFMHKLTAHVQRKHLRTRNYACQLCEKKYMDRSTLEEHMNAVHTGKRPFKCNECGKAYARRETLNQHKNVHSKIRHPCDLCGKKFSFKQNLRVHKKNIHGFMI